jgi:hypothetical protein
MEYGFAVRSEKRLMADKAEEGASRRAMGAGAGGGRRAGASGDAELDPRVQGEIGRQLRAVYDDIISEPIPDRFLELLQQLEKSAGKKR